MFGEFSPADDGESPTPVGTGRAHIETSSHIQNRVEMTAHPDAFDTTAGEHAVVIAPSAGGIEALQTILPLLPADFAAPVILVLHRTNRRGELLAKVLARCTALSVKNAEDGERLEPGVLYIAPPDRHASITDDKRIALRDHTKISFVSSSADPLFRSAAAVYGAGAVGIVLTGSGRNGAGGALAVRDAGGAVIAQDEATSKHFGMPRAAIEAGAATSILPLDEIAAQLRRAVNGASRLRKAKV